MLKNDVIEKLNISLVESKWVAESIVNEIQYDGYNYREPLRGIRWLPIDIFNKACYILADMGILGRTYVYEQIGYDDKEELYKEECIPRGTPVEVHYWYRDSIVD
jgi:hypothetical protein